MEKKKNTGKNFTFFTLLVGFLENFHVALPMDFSCKRN